MSARLVSATFAVLLASCSPMQWYKPGMDEATQARDVDGCRRQARERSYHELNARLALQPYGVGADPRGQSILVPPMSAEGDRAMIEETLMQNCMRGLGYDLAPRSGNRAR